MRRRAPAQVIVLGAAGSGAAALTQALGAGAAVHGFDDGGLCAALVEILEAFDDAELDPDARAARVQELAAAPASEEVRAALAEFLARAPGAKDRMLTRAAAREQLDAVCRARAQAAGKREAVVHAEGCATRVAALGDALPKAIFVHVVRDGRMIALARSGEGGIAAAAGAWLQEITPALAFETEEPERVLKVAYEDLLATPETLLAELCAAAGLEPDPPAMAIAFRAALGDSGEHAFRTDLLDGWQTIELEGALAPVLALLGYRPAAELEGVTRLRRQAAAYETLLAENGALRAQLDARGGPPDRGLAGAGGSSGASAGELPLDLRTLRWKAKRYDQIRAAASPLIRLRRLRSRER
jgi:hypothetical protein